MLTTVGVAGAIPAAYPKTVGGVAYAASFNPTSGGRRSYPSITTFASPSYTDTPGWTNWPGGGPLGLGSAGYTLQGRVTEDRFEGINGAFANHHSDLAVGGVSFVPNVNNPSNNNYDSGYVNVSSSASGAITFHDYCSSNPGGTAFTGNITFYYRYTRP